MTFFPSIDSFATPGDAFLTFGMMANGMSLYDAQNAQAVQNMQYTQAAENEQAVEDKQLVSHEQTMDVGEIDLICEQGDFTIFDTETTGTSRNDVVIQLSVVVFDTAGTPIYVYNEYWNKPEGIRIDPRAEEVHKISESLLYSKSQNARSELLHVIGLFEKLKRNNIPIVAHNASFDFRMMKQTAEMQCINWPFERKDFFCTASASRQHVKALGKNDQIKMPTNVELYQFFRGEKPEGALHDALIDCKVTAVGYMGGRSRGWW